MPAKTRVAPGEEEKQMRLHGVHILKPSIAVTFGLALYGCAIVPSPNSPIDPVHKVEIAYVVNLVKCEMTEAFKPYVTPGLPTYQAWLTTWTAVAKLNLKVDMQGNVSPSLSFITPSPDIATATNKFSGLARTFGFSFNYSQTDTLQTGLQFTLDLGHLASYDCNAMDASFSGVTNGDLGLKDWIDKAVAAAKSTHLVQNADSVRAQRIFANKITSGPTDKAREQPDQQQLKSILGSEENKPENLKDPASVTQPFDSLDYSVTFAVVTGAGFTPGFTLIHFKDSATGNMLGTQRTNTNILDIALAKPSQAPSHNAASTLEPSQQHLNDLLELQLQRSTISTGP